MGENSKRGQECFSIPGYVERLSFLSWSKAECRWLKPKNIARPHVLTWGKPPKLKIWAYSNAYISTRSSKICFSSKNQTFIISSRTVKICLPLRLF